MATREWGYESLVNPVQGIRKPTVPPGRDRRLIGDEETRLLRSIRESGSPWGREIVPFAIETAMRQGEILALRWSDVDIERRIATLHITKNGERRYVPLSSEAVRILREIGPKNQGPVFNRTYDALKSAFQRACNKAEIDDFRFHDLRHEATSRLFEKGTQSDRSCNNNRS